MVQAVLVVHLHEVLGTAPVSANAQKSVLETQKTFNVNDSVHIYIIYTYIYADKNRSTPVFGSIHSLNAYTEMLRRVHKEGIYL